MIPYRWATVVQHLFDTSNTNLIQLDSNICCAIHLKMHRTVSNAMYNNGSQSHKRYTNVKQTYSQGRLCSSSGSDKSKKGDGRKLHFKKFDVIDSIWEIMSKRLKTLFLFFQTEMPKKILLLQVDFRFYRVSTSIQKVVSPYFLPE